MKFHFYDIIIPKQYLYRLLNSAAKITLRNIRKNEESAFFEIDAKEYLKLSEIMERNNIPCNGKKEGGLLKHLKFTKVKLVVITFVICLGILKWNALFIWKISVEGNYTYTEQQITEFLKSHHYTEGILKKDFPCEEIENLIRNHFSEISWVSCEMKGTNLILHLKENYIAEITKTEQRPYHLVSEVDGIVQSIIVRNGIAKVKTGDRIKKGAVVISGRVEIRDESDQVIMEKDCCADGDVLARVVHKYEDTVDEKQLELNRENSYNLFFPQVKGFSLKIGKNRYKEIWEQRLCLFGNYYLPVSMKCYRIYKEEPVERILSKKEAKEILHHKMLYYFAQLEQKGYKILEKDVKIEKVASKYWMKGKYTCIEPVGKVRYIHHKTEKKEGKSDERN